MRKRTERPRSTEPGDADRLATEVEALDKILCDLERLSVIHELVEKTQNPETTNGRPVRPDEWALAKKIVDLAEELFGALLEASVLREQRPVSVHRYSIRYYKPSGKYYTSDSFEASGQFYEVIKTVVRWREFKTLPGLTSGSWDGPIVIETPFGLDHLIEG